MDTPDSTTTKRCTKCGEEKPISAFSRHSGFSDGVRSACKDCERAYRAENSEAIHKNKREYYAANREREKERARQWVAANPDRKRDHSRESARRKRAIDPQGYNERQRSYRHAKPELNREACRKWRKNNPDYKERAIAYGKTDHGKAVKRGVDHRRQARKRNLPDTFTTADSEKAFNAFNGCCAVCGRAPGLWHTIALDHWIPLSSPDCPGTVPWNMVPLCHDKKGGHNACNNTKHNKSAETWLIERCGKRKGRAILQRVEAYLEAQRREVT